MSLRLQSIIILLFCLSAHAQWVTNWSTNVTVSMSSTATNKVTNIVETVTLSSLIQAPTITAVAKPPTNTVEAGAGGLFASNLLNAIGAPKGVQGVVSSVQLGLLDSVPYLDNPFSVQGGALWNPSFSQKRFGYFADATFAMAKQAGIGIGCANLDGHWFAGSVSLQLGTTVKLRLIGQVFFSVKDGPEYDLQTKSVGNYLFAGVDKKFHLWETDWTIGAGVGNFSTLKGTVVGAGLTGTFKDFSALWPF